MHLLCFLVLLFPMLTTAQSTPVDSAQVLVIGTKEAPPFAIKQADGSWQGISINLWEAVAEDLGLRYEFRETDLPGLLAGVEDGFYDAGVAALTITAEREERMDFSHPFHVSGLGIAVQLEEGGLWLAVQRLVSPTFLKVVGALFGLLLLVGAAVWLFERRHNPEQFGGSAAQGIASGFWWSAVTMTTVGYGDKAPVSLGGRLLAIVWMFAAIIMVSSFTAAIASALTVSRLEARVQGPDDLPDVRVGSLGASTSASYLERRRTTFRAFDTPEVALRALADDELDAVVYDVPILRHLIQNEYTSILNVLPVTLETQYYGIALPVNSPLREPLNHALLERITDPTWQEVLYRYLGE